MLLAMLPILLIAPPLVAEGPSNPAFDQFEAVAIRRREFTLRHQPRHVEEPVTGKVAKLFCAQGQGRGSTKSLLAWFGQPPTRRWPPTMRGHARWRLPAKLETVAQSRPGLPDS